MTEVVLRRSRLQHIVVHGTVEPRYLEVAKFCPLAATI